jgi:fructan beta-fructosidase
MNDPNGLAYANGRWQLFYQHNPHDVVWDAMHWGSAVSDDLLTWEHREIALAPGPKGVAFSGSAVVDATNSAGFGLNALVAVFTQVGERQTQAVAFSVDGGLTFEEYAHNPVLDAPHGIVDFRDPKVFRHDDAWVMALAVEQGVWFYRSVDLITWEKTGEFFDPSFDTKRAWETPDVFLLPVEGTDESAWVLTIGVQDEAPLGGSGTCYWIGELADGGFCAHVEAQWADLGPDFYAPQSWNHAPDEKRTWVGWMNNCHYAHNAPVVFDAAADSASRGVLSCPRVLTLRHGVDGLHMVQRPVDALSDLAGSELAPTTIGDTREHSSTVAGEDVVTLQFVPNVDLGLDDLVTLRIADPDEVMHVELTITQATVSITRQAWHTDVAAPMNCRSDAFVGQFRSLFVIVGRTTIECFINDGEKVFSALTRRCGDIEITMGSAREIGCDIAIANLTTSLGARALQSAATHDAPENPLPSS